MPLRKEEMQRLLSSGSHQAEYAPFWKKVHRVPGLEVQVIGAPATWVDLRPYPGSWGSVSSG